MRWIPGLIIVFAAIGCAGIALAHPIPVIGPQTYPVTDGETVTYTERFQSPADDEFVLFLRNGDAEGGRVTAAIVEINGSAVVGPSDLGESAAGVRRGVELEAGENELVIQLEGEPGSYVTLAIYPRGAPPLFVHGRLLLPWGRDDDEVALGLALRNGSTWAPRALRVVFLDPGGAVTARSGRIVLPRRGSLAAAVRDLIETGSWEAGSIEIYFAGPGRARVFGTARQWNLLASDSDVQTLTNAGTHVYRPLPERGEIQSARPSRS